LLKLTIFLSSEQTKNKKISRKKAQAAQKGKHQLFAYFVLFYGKHLILIQCCG